MDKSKFIQKLKTKYKDLGFSDKAIDGVASYLGATVADDAKDEDIDNAIDGVEPILKAFQGEIDSRATAAAEKAKKDASKPKQEPGGAPAKTEPEKTLADMPEWAKTFAKQMETLASGLSNLQAEKTTGTRKQTLEEKLKDAPETFKNKVLKDFGRMKFETDEEFQSYLTETEEDAKAFDQEITDKGLGLQTPPQKGKETKGDKPATKEEVKDVVDSIM